MEREELDNILANLAAVLAQEEGINKVAEILADGYATMQELQNTGKITPSIKAKLEEKVATLKISKEEDTKWQEASSLHTIASYSGYLSAYSQGKYATMAQEAIKSIIDDNLISQKQQYLNALKENINAYGPEVLKSYQIGVNDILNAGISVPQPILNIFDNSGIDLNIGETPKSIPPGQTEVYFWGTPGSGKTCTIAAILSTADDMGVLKEKPCEGIEYMRQLSNVFHEQVGTLPKPTPTEVTQRLSFDLFDEDLNPHPVSLMELSGEVFRAFADITAGKEPQASVKNSLLSLLGFLADTRNPKFHFFVVDVTNNSLDDKGYSQRKYLSAAATFFENNNIFNDKTAGVYVLVTKSDLLSPDVSVRTHEAIELLSDKYKSFVNTLKVIAANKRIIRSKTDKIRVVPFTIGDVYFQNKCQFNPQMSKEVIKILQDNISKETKTSIFGWLRN